MKIDIKGQITVELLLLISFALITAIVLANVVMDSNELNMAMASTDWNRKALNRTMSSSTTMAESRHIPTTPEAYKEASAMDRTSTSALLSSR